MTKTADYDQLFNQRSGRWTRIHYFENHILFKPSPTHKAGTIFCILFIVALGASFTASYNNIEMTPTFSAIALAGIIAVILGHLLQSNKANPNDIAIILKNDKALSLPCQTQIDEQDIIRIIATENSGRYNEDPPLMQLWLVIKQNEKILIYQHYMYSKEKVFATGKKLADILKKPFKIIKQ